MAHPGARARSAASGTGTAALTPCDGDRSLRAAKRLFERHRHLGVETRPTLRRIASRAAFGQHFGEQIAEGRRVVDTPCGEIEPLETGRSNRVRLARIARVVPGSAGRIDQRLIRLEDLTESRLGGAITRIDVRMIPSRESSIRPLDLGLRRAVRHT